ncbi:MAG: hypothetical protein KBG28_27725 [Kofleriaceae bacterium]|nr:hypothetical protein [Kofleriaceae bacterium]MBP9207785.1 hypothetical protein [Kofleriaceae bacterium]
MPAPALTLSPGAMVGAVLGALQRRFWVVGVATVVVCASLAARTAGHLVEAWVLGDAATAPPRPRLAMAPTARPGAAPAEPTEPAGGVALVERNMFCADCAPATPALVVAGPGDEVPATQLPIELIATSLGDRATAVLRGASGWPQGAFAVGDAFPAVGPGASAGIEVVRIAGRFVDLRNPQTQRVERLRLGQASATTDRDQALAAGDRGGAAPAAASAWADRIRKVGENSFEVERSVIQELVAGGPVKGMRAQPVLKDGEIAGLRLLSARPDSVAGALGLRSGDVLEAIDQQRITSAQQLLELYGKLATTSSVSIQGSRRGQPLELRFALR